MLKIEDLAGTSEWLTEVNFGEILTKDQITTIWQEFFIMPVTSSVINVNIMHKYDLLEREPILDDHDYADVRNVSVSSP